MSEITDLPYEMVYFIKTGRYMTEYNRITVTYKQLPSGLNSQC